MLRLTGLEQSEEVGQILRRQVLSCATSSIGEDLHDLYTRKGEWTISVGGLDNVLARGLNNFC